MFPTRMQTREHMFMSVCVCSRVRVVSDTLSLTGCTHLPDRLPRGRDMHLSGQVCWS